MSHNVKRTGVIVFVKPYTVLTEGTSCIDHFHTQYLMRCATTSNKYNITITKQNVLKIVVAIAATRVY